MRRPVGILLGLAALILAIVAAVYYNKYEKTQNDLSASQQAQEKSEGNYQKTMDAIAEIQDSLNAISLGDTSVSRLPWNPEPGQKLSRADEQQALERIALLRQSISRNRERIDDLESRLKKNGVQVAGLHKMIDQLKRQLDDKQEIVMLLNSRVDDLSQQVTGLSRTVMSRDSTIAINTNVIEDKRKELATVYYIVGDKKALTKAGAIQSSGGVAFLGKTVRPNPMATYTAFTPMDTDQETVIRTTAPKARLVSSQSATSYTWMMVDGVMELHITNPAEFRKIREVVILTS
jgi:peptidoglycan hydrolase CwlO-like protein